MMTKRRKFSPEFKARVVLELISGDKGLMQASREYEIKDSVLSRWKQEFLERAPQLFEQPQAATSPQDERIAELERMVGRLALQLDMAKKYSIVPATHRREASDGGHPGGVVWPSHRTGLRVGGPATQQLLLSQP